MKARIRTLGRLVFVFGVGIGLLASQGLAEPIPETTQTLPRSFNEAPMLAELVAEGKLPPVEERLPENPAIVTPVEQIGKYGGTLRRQASNVNDIQFNYRMGYEPLVRWGRDGTTIEPGIAERWEMLDGGRTFIFHLRKGMKWSDGHPLTSADFKFTFDYVLDYPGFSHFFLQWLRMDNELPECETPDPYTVIYRFKTPYGSFLRGLAASGLQHGFFGPKHYLEQFHEALVPEEEMRRMVREAGFVTWSDFFLQRLDLHRNPDLPTAAAWKIEIPPPATRCTAVRNPYYYKVDPEGNQLPYIDRMTIDMTYDRTVLNLKVASGEVDFQMRNVDASNFTLFRERGRQLGYRTLVTPSTNPICIYLNQHSRNEKLRPYLKDRRFRKALSHAINREELIELIFSGLATTSSAISMPSDPFYVPGVESANIEYDPELANRLLDEVGLKRRKSDGLRTFPDGTLFAEIMNVYPSEEGSNADLWQLVVDYWREVGLKFTPKLDDQTLGFLQATNGNSDFFCYANATLHWDVDGVWKVPISNMSYLAPLYGTYFQTDGKRGEKPSEDMQRLLDLFYNLRSTPDPEVRVHYGQQIIRQWAEECYVVGLCQPPVLTIASNRLRNVPEVINYDYRLKSPGYINVEQFYLDDETGDAK